MITDLNGKKQQQGYVQLKAMEGEGRRTTTTISKDNINILQIKQVNFKLIQFSQFDSIHLSGSWETSIQMHKKRLFNWECILWNWKTIGLQREREREKERRRKKLSKEKKKIDWSWIENHSLFFFLLLLVWEISNCLLPWFAWELSYRFISVDI